MILQKDYKTYLAVELSNDVIGDVNGEIEINLDDVVDSDIGFLLFEPGNTNQESIFFHRRVGSTVYCYGVNRDQPVVHLENSQVLVVNSIDYMNYLLEQTNRQLYIYKKSLQHIVCVGGVFYINGKNIILSNLDTEEALTNKTLTSNATNYLYIFEEDFHITTTPITEEAYLIATLVVGVGGNIDILTKHKTFIVGNKGEQGEAATIQIGTVESGSSPSVTNSGTVNDAILNFVLKQGDKGDQGDPGSEVMIRVSGGYIQWKLESDLVWINLVTIASISGIDGIDGTNGKNIELQKTSTYIQWRNVGDTVWINLVALVDLKGTNAPNTKIQYSIDGSTLWHITFVAGDMYIRFSTDDGSTWTAGYKFIGDNGEGSGNFMADGSIQMTGDLNMGGNDVNNINGIGNKILSTNASKNISELDTATYPSLTELSYVKGVTSPVQPQINALQQISYYAGVMNVNSGTLDTGIVTDLQALGGTDINISEVTGVNALEVSFEFTGITKMNYFVFYGHYLGGSGHQVSVEIYNHLTTNWDELGMIGSETSKKWYSFGIFNSASYISSGNVLVRFRHIQSGNVTHDLILDYLEIAYGGAGGQSGIEAASIIFTPTGNLSATNVASALIELDTEKESLANKGQASGYAPLGGDGKVSSTYLPSYVDDVLEFSTYGDLPVTGETGKVYVILTGAEANRQYRWSGTIYVEIKDSGETTTSLGGLINGADAKTTPADNDMFGLMDSAAGNIIKKFSWANLKTALKSYFDTLTTTFTNKTIVKRVVVVTQSATPAINVNNGDIFSITGLAQAITSMSSGLSGTPVEGQMMMIQITDNGSARTITWGASFVSGTNATLPIATTVNVMKVVLLQYTGSTWKCLAVD